MASKVISDINQTQITPSYQLSGPLQEREIKIVAINSEPEKCKIFPWYYRRSAGELEELIRHGKADQSKVVTENEVNEELGPDETRGKILAGKTLFRN